MAPETPLVPGRIPPPVSGTTVSGGRERGSQVSVPLGLQVQTLHRPRGDVVVLFRPSPSTLSTKSAPRPAPALVRPRAVPRGRGNHKGKDLTLT